jgi:hypothetical protein
MNLNYTLKSGKTVRACVFMDMFEAYSERNSLLVSTEAGVTKCSLFGEEGKKYFIVNSEKVCIDDFDSIRISSELSDEAIQNLTSESMMNALMRASLNGHSLKVKGTDNSAEAKVVEYEVTMPEEGRVKLTLTTGDEGSKVMTVSDLLIGLKEKVFEIA